MKKLISKIRNNKNLNLLKVVYSEYSETDDELDLTQGENKAWFYWFSFPGCLPESEPFGPFDTEKQALEDALSVFG